MFTFELAWTNSGPKHLHSSSRVIAPKKNSYLLTPTSLTSFKIIEYNATFLLLFLPPKYIKVFYGYEKNRSFELFSRCDGTYFFTLIMYKIEKLSRKYKYILFEKDLNLE